MRWLGVLCVVACSYAPRRIDPDPIPIADGPPLDVAVTIDAPTGTPAERCTTKYGGAGVQFELCSSTDTSCTFFVDVGGGNQVTCATICEPLGGLCIDNRDGNCGDRNNPEQCAGTHADQVCTCSL